VNHHDVCRKCEKWQMRVVAVKGETSIEVPNQSGCLIYGTPRLIEKSGSVTVPHGCPFITEHLMLNDANPWGTLFDLRFKDWPEFWGLSWAKSPVLTTVAGVMVGWMVLFYTLLCEAWRLTPFRRR